MKDKQKKIDHYLKIIDEIEKIRTHNNVNWMNILRLAIKHAPEDAIDLLKKVDGIEFCRLGTSDVVRHRLVKDIIKAYDKK